VPVLALSAGASSFSRWARRRAASHLLQPGCCRATHLAGWCTPPHHATPHPLLSPDPQVQNRYAELEECYRFFCQCTRCKAEFEAPDELSELLNAIMVKVGTQVGGRMGAGSACSWAPAGCRRRRPLAAGQGLGI
jgi:hypothetical protein